MSYRLLRTCSIVLAVLGWMNWAFFFLLGFVPLVIPVEQLIPINAPWQMWVIYLAPFFGFVFGGLTALGYFIGSQLIRVFLDQRDSLGELLVVNRRVLKIIEGRKPGGGTRQSDLFPIDESLDDDLPSL